MSFKDIPHGSKVIKPWGSEYTIHKNKETSTKLLKMLPNMKTSLHCHPIKKTGFILLQGKVNVDLGFYDTRELISPEKLMIRPGLFHSTKNINNKISTILEIETPIDKDDLVRFKDEYGRENQPYEGQNKMKNLDETDIIFEDPILNSINEYNIEGIEIKIEKTDKTEYLKNRNKKTIFAILEGGLFSKDGRKVLSSGDIVRTDTIDKLTEVFEVKNTITFLTLNYE